MKETFDRERRKPTSRENAFSCFFCILFINRICKMERIECTDIWTEMSSDNSEARCFNNMPMILLGLSPSLLC
jgi:hypothetical protein